MEVLKNLKVMCLAFFQFYKLDEQQLKKIGLEQCWQVSRLNLPMNTTFQCNCYAQQKYFVLFVLPGIVEFIHKDMTFCGNTVIKQGMSDLAKPCNDWVKFNVANRWIFKEVELPQKGLVTNQVPCLVLVLAIYIHVITLTHGCLKVHG